MDTIELLKLAAYKMGEMLNFGEFDPEHKANFERALEKIKAGIPRDEAA